MHKLKIATDYALFTLLIIACYIGYQHAEGLNNMIINLKGN